MCLQDSFDEALYRNLSTRRSGIHEGAELGISKHDYRPGVLRRGQVVRGSEGYLQQVTTGERGRKIKSSLDNGQAMEMGVAVVFGWRTNELNYLQEEV